MISTANKCIHGLPGISFVIIEENYLSEMSHFPERNLYLNIVNSHLLQVKGETSFTPAIQIMYAPLKDHKIIILWFWTILFEALPYKKFNPSRSLLGYRKRGGYSHFKIISFLWNIRVCIIQLTLDLISDSLTVL